jgi:hypothetical protein
MSQWHLLWGTYEIRAYILTLLQIKDQAELWLYYGSITCKTLGCAWSHKVTFDIMAFRFSCSFHKAFALFFLCIFRLLTSSFLDLLKYGRPNIGCSRAFRFQKILFYD